MERFVLEWFLMAQIAAPFSAPHGNHGESRGDKLLTIAPKMIAIQSDRPRINLDLSPSVLLLLDHVVEITGASRSSLINAALVDALPGLLERSDGLQKRSMALIQPNQSKKR